jgi:TusA-related sulfurtransferase
MGKEHLLDVRDMESPAPLLAALMELETLAPGDYLRMLSRRDPALLYPMLTSQGFSYTRQRTPGAAYEILIWRAGDVAAEQAARALAAAATDSPV